MEAGTEIPQISENRSTITQPLHSWEFIQRKLNQHMRVFLYSHVYSNSISNQDTYQLITG